MLGDYDLLFGSDSFVGQDPLGDLDDQSAAIDRTPMEASGSHGMEFAEQEEGSMHFSNQDQHDGSNGVVGANNALSALADAAERRTQEQSPDQGK